MVNRRLELQWKPIEINDPDLVSAGLVAIEECMDYDVVQPPLKKTKVRKEKGGDKHKKKKQNLSKTEEDFKLQESPSKSGSTQKMDTSEGDVEVSDYSEWNNYGLQESIVKGLNELNFLEPTLIQRLTLPAAVLGHRDIIGAAETGSGKTLAFGLPILTGILNKKSDNESKDHLYALVLTPTRELAIQVKNHLLAAAKYTGINIAVVVGGMAAVKQERILNKSPEIVVATPGRLWELLQLGNQHLSQIADIKYLVIDETDRMLEAGHFEELDSILELLNSDKVKSESRQNFVFSATLTLVHDLPKYLARKLKRSKLKMMSPEQKLQRIVQTLNITNPKIVDVTKGSGISNTLTESRITCEFEEKDYYVYYFLQRHPGRTIIFCNSIGCVKRLANLLNVLGCKPLPLHANMQQRQRLKNLDRFREDKHGILVATDVAARGLDIPNVEHVLHYQTPRTSESYVHRSGRTARASKSGITVLLMESSEIQSYLNLCKSLNKVEDIPVFPIQDNYLTAVKQRVNLAREIDILQLQIRKTNSEAGWLQKAAEEMDIIVDDFVKKYDDDEIVPQKKTLAMKQTHLAELLSQPVFPKGFTGKYLLDHSQFLSAADDKTESAVELVQNSINKKLKKRADPFRSKGKKIKK